ncbi:transposase [Nitrosococcus oceani]|nr:transposase [Nitrosococcus oceani]GEM20820.1 IS630 family transposase [Nitrosococcus oceani]
MHPKGCEGARRAFQTLITWHRLNKRPIVYIDESGFAHDMPRTHGYAPKGLRCFGERDWDAKGRTHAMGALIGKALLSVALFSVALFNVNVNADVFTAWVAQDLLPKLPAQSIVVMDNATFHKREDTQNMIRNAGDGLLYLPAYSPDLNPIEQKWAQAKALRRQTHRSIDEIFTENQFI